MVRIKDTFCSLSRSGGLSTMFFRADQDIAASTLQEGGFCTFVVIYVINIVHTLLLCRSLVGLIRPIDKTSLSHLTIF